MPAIRKASVTDAPAWQQLLQGAVGKDYPDQQIFDPAWGATQLQEAEAETWVAEEGGKITAALSFLSPSMESRNPVGNIGRHFNSGEAFSSGAAALLLQKAVEMALERKQLLISRVIASDRQQQLLYESGGFICVGFQPFKHAHGARENILFYCHVGGHDLARRSPVGETLPAVSELARLSLAGCNLPGPEPARESIPGYPLSGGMEFREGTQDDFELWSIQAQSTNPAVEISGAYNIGAGYVRTAGAERPLCVLGEKNGRVCAGILFILDSVDRCVRLIGSFSTDDSTLGAVLTEAVRWGEQKHGASYVELDVLATAGRMLKSAEQMGFVPVAYFPAVHYNAGSCVDVVKLAKLNLVYSLENVSLSAQAARMTELVDQSFQDQKMGVAIVTLLRGLPFFEGLGDGELRKVARLFEQKLFRAGDTIFNTADSSNEAYVVMRGKVDILLNATPKPLAQFGNGQIFGELAFLDGTPRAARAVAAQPSILLVIQRSAFNSLVDREPHLGMVVMRNIARELSSRLRKANQGLPR